MDFKQAENNFEKLKAEFAAGALSEARFKAQLEELMLQDEEGNWWMIGYETEQWYRHDRKEWVQTNPPGFTSKPPAVSPLLQGMSAEVSTATPVEQRFGWSFGRDEFRQSAIGMAVFALLFFLIGAATLGFTDHILYTQRSLAFAFAVPLFFGAVFGPLVGAAVGAGTYLIYIITRAFFGALDSDFIFASAFAFALEGFIMGFARRPADNLLSFQGILRLELFVLFASFVASFFYINSVYLFDDYYRQNFGPILTWRLVLLPIALIVYSSILARGKPAAW